MTSRVRYTQDELVQAYNEWVALAWRAAPRALGDNIPMPDYAPRQTAWDHYCDIRDCLPQGTTHARRGAGPALRLVSSRATAGAEEVMP